MKPNTLIAGGIALALAGAAGFGLYQLGVHNGTAVKPMTISAPATGAADGEDATRRHITSGLKAGDVDPVTGRTILYYHDPMTPASRFYKPGKSPFMDMMLVPVFGGASAADQNQVTVSPRVQQNLGLRTAAVTEGRLGAQLGVPGNIAFNERDQSIVQARAGGFVQHLHVRATLDHVAKGQPLVDLLLPEWVAAQEELLSVKRLQGPDMGVLIEGARQRMRLAGMDDALIQRVESSGKTEARITITAPTGGVVTELLVREGMTVMPGATLFRINGLGTVWALAEVPESQAALARPGTRVQATSSAIPGKTWEGKVQALLPDVNAATRTIRARVELANADGRLVPGMFISMQLMDTQAANALLIPSEAVIQTGKRAVVMLAEDGGRFRPVEIEAGIESNGQTEVRHGLTLGQRVVVSSQFLIDSEASLRGLEGRLNHAPAAAAAPVHTGQGKVESIDGDTAMLSHGPIPSLKWGPMTMEFKLPAPTERPKGLKAGDAVSFDFTMQADGTAQIVRMTPRAAGSAP
jgi:Cu(I)/Ag(I) efflux system membrane fusion protein